MPQVFQQTVWVGGTGEQDEGQEVVWPRREMRAGLERARPFSVFCRATTPADCSRPESLMPSFCTTSFALRIAVARKSSRRKVLKATLRTLFPQWRRALSREVPNAPDFSVLVQFQLEITETPVLTSLGG
jgi:hypothetical protein